MRASTRESRSPNPARRAGRIDTLRYVATLGYMAHTPTYIIYHSKATGAAKGSKKIWTRIGAVWANKSGKGSTLTWDYLPLAQGITIMLPYDARHGDFQIVPDQQSA